ncbi:xanthine and CO dehydrogenases maturation factor [Desulfocucumis palustris]|uniref:Xanthine and CO dehydrogenases maturation factor n=1 Tax=Desulfocucumis palustris TaxID=1898651 RepID=A0A2L2XG41_9FIRM|nr:XdhC/CoxI family protein [Desulfocucumis palustris]GBF35218.1 xanthine and CO dehydrogenases maturation factor [Desulfocucumis palustris]
MKAIIKDICSLLNSGESFSLATILSQSGSSPRTAGTKMIVRSDGSILGTIGGGLLEAQVMRLASDVLQSPRAVTRVFNLTGKDAGQMDMICGGRLEVLVDYLDASDVSTVDAYNAMELAVDNRERTMLVTPIPAAEEDASYGKPCLVKGDGILPGGLPELISQSGGRRPEVVTAGEKRFLVEPACDLGTVYIFGAGHVSQKIAPLATLVDFRTVVLDDRGEFANRERFPTADRVMVLDTFERALEGLEIDRDSYLVIVTRGHAHDKTVLGQALKTNAGYIGMIGSRRKRDAIYKALSAEGFARDEFARVYCPIGLEIEAETPEEIAVSVMAELIKVRAELG